MYKSLSGQAPQYLADDVQLLADSGQRLLQSANYRTCVVPWTQRLCIFPAPLYLRTLWRYTNAVIIIIIRTVLATETFLLPDLESGTICHRNCDTRISALGNSETC